MKVLIVKLTSMGDVLHTLPALSDLYSSYPDLEVDWVVEESFQEIPLWHPAVKRVIPAATRRWRNKKNQSQTSCRLTEIRQFLSLLRERQYDFVVDAQGLIKSAIVARLAKGKRIGFSGNSIKESPAAWLYNLSEQVPRKQHAVDRLRQLFSQSFDYDYKDLPLAYGLGDYQEPSQGAPYLMFFHATTWTTKHMPVAHWIELADLAGQAGFGVKLPWGNQSERKRAEQIAESVDCAEVLPKTKLSQLRDMTAASSGAIAVDTGLGHLAAALGVPCLSVYGSTDSKLTGTKGFRQTHLRVSMECSPCLAKECRLIDGPMQQIPCYQTVSSSQIWHQFSDILLSKDPS